MHSESELYYVGDPMCSWCWGFSPVLDALTKSTPLPVRLIVGGLRPDERAQQLDETMRGYLREAWQAVKRASGQSFFWDWLDRSDFLYDTGPACRAVVCAKHLDENRAQTYYHRLQKAFYAEGQDITLADVLADLAEECGYVRSDFARWLTSDECAKQTQQDYAMAQQLQVQGFPTMLLKKGEQWIVLSQGFTDLDTMNQRLKMALELEA